MGLIGLAIASNAVKLVPTGDRLEFRVKGPQVTPGYYRDPQATAGAFDEEGFYRLGDAARLVDRDRPQAGLIFDGRLSENFKFASGTFVTGGALRIQALCAIGGAAIDAVVCGRIKRTWVCCCFSTGVSGSGRRRRRPSSARRRRWRRSGPESSNSTVRFAVDLESSVLLSSRIPRCGQR